MTAEDMGALAPANWARSVVTAVIIGESGGHGLKGCEAVYEVIHSRASRKRSTCLYEVLKPWQFEPINKPMTPAKLVEKHRGHPMWDKVYEFVGKRPQYTHTGTRWDNACTHFHAVSEAPFWSFETKIDPKTGKRVPVLKDGKKIPLTPFRVFGGHKWYNNVK